MKAHKALVSFNSDKIQERGKKIPFEVESGFEVYLDFFFPFCLDV